VDTRLLHVQGGPAAPRCTGNAGGAVCSGEYITSTEYSSWMKRSAGCDVDTCDGGKSVPGPDPPWGAGVLRGRLSVSRHLPLAHQDDDWVRGFCCPRDPGRTGWNSAGSRARGPTIIASRPRAVAMKVPRLPHHALRAQRTAWANYEAGVARIRTWLPRAMLRGVHRRRDVRVRSSREPS
jgi:hypothetical protein